MFNAPDDAACIGHRYLYYVKRGTIPKPVMDKNIKEFSKRSQLNSTNFDME